MPTSIPLPQIKFGKTKERSQMNLVYTGDGRILEREFPCGISSINDDDHRSRYLIDPDNQYQGDDGNMYQMLFDKDAVPLCLRKTSKYRDGIEDEKDMKSLRAGIFKQAFKDKQMEGIESINNSDAWDKAYKIVMLICATILVIVAIRWKTGGFG